MILWYVNVIRKEKAMARKFSDEVIKKINELYVEIGTYSGVAKEIGCAPSTVKKYIQKDYSFVEKPIEINIDLELPDINSIDFEPFFPHIQDICKLSKVELKEL